jgi:hypothetical protein
MKKLMVQSVLLLSLILSGCNSNANEVSQEVFSADVLPKPEQLPPMLRLDSSGSRTNAETASYYDEPEGVLRNLESLGRVISFWENYVSTEGCGGGNGFSQITFQAVLYSSSEGAHYGFDAFHTIDEQEGGFSREVWNDEVGEEGYRLRGERKSECNPSMDMVGMIISFRRLNVHAEVYTEMGKGVDTDEVLYEAAVDLARIIDSNIRDLAGK